MKNRLARPFLALSRFALFLFAVAVLLAGGAAAVRGQSALDGFYPDVDGTVNVVVAQPDGKVLIGGSFLGVLGVQRQNIARLNPDGSLDTAFYPSMANNAIVNAIALQPDGKILVGGNFFSIGGPGRNYIGRLDATTGSADSFNPNANGEVTSIAVQADGKVLVGGFFTNIGGQTRTRIARLDATTGLADSFNPNANSQVYSIAVQADGKILVGGGFSGANSIGGQDRNYIARLDPTTGLADSFNPNATGSAVRSIAVQADSKILTGGNFTVVGGQLRNNIARLDPTTGLADSFNPNAGNTVYSIALQADGKILVGGGFSGANSIGGQDRNYIARLDATTGLADSFNPNAGNTVFSIVVQADGKILAGGEFTTFAPNGGASVLRNRIARLETDGTLDQTLNLSILGSVSGFYVRTTAVQPDGKILIGGTFDNVLGVTRNNIARLNTDGTLDTAFNPNAIGGLGPVSAIAVQADGKILVGGNFTSIGGQTRSRIARLDPTTGLADSFNPNANDRVGSIAVQADGKILVGGSFTSIGGQTRNIIARLNTDGTLDTAFNPNAIGAFVESIVVQADGKILVGGSFGITGGQTRNYIARLDAMTGLPDSFNANSHGIVYSIAVQADGKVIAGGSFTTIGGTTRNRIARLDAVTGLADLFNPNANSDVYSIAVQGDGRILAGGTFVTIGGQTRSRIARLDATTGLADSFNPNANNFVSAIAVQADGKILVGGFFTSIGPPRNYFARLSNDTAALQNLAVTQTTITWTRGGSSPQFARVTFESSTDNVTYTSLGNGTAAGSNWTLPGLNLPFGQNIYIRARGHYPGGWTNGSESIVESVRNAFLGALQLTAAVSRKTHGGTGDFDINLPLDGGLGVECRNSNGNHTLVFTTSNNLVGGNASVTTGTGSVSGSPTFSGNTMTVNLTGVTDVQRITLALSGVTDSFAQVLPDTAFSVGFLIGDTNGDRFVNAGDTVQTRSRSGQTTDATNFRSDVNRDGTINSGDQITVRARSGNSLP